MAYMFDGDHLARCLFNGLVHYTKAAACSRKRLATSIDGRRGGGAYDQAPPAPGSGWQRLRRPLREARAKGSVLSQRTLSPGQSRGKVEETRRRGKDGGDWLRIGRDLGRRTWRQGIHEQEEKGRES